MNEWMNEWMKEWMNEWINVILRIFRCVHASLYEGLSFGPSVRPWVSRFFGSRKLTNLTYLTNLIPAILTNLTESYKSDKSLCNSILVPYFRRIFVRTNLFSFCYHLTNKEAIFKQGCIHDCISHVCWAGAVMEVRSPFGWKK